MRTDRYFYDPGPLAVGKGMAYFISFFTTVQFDNTREFSYYVGILLFSCGIICDYIEIAAYKVEKCNWLRIIAFFISVAFGLVIAFLLVLLSKFDGFPTVLDFVDRYYININVLFAFFWFLPFCNGILLCCKTIVCSKRAKRKPAAKFAAGYYVKP